MVNAPVSLDAGTAEAWRDLVAVLPELRPSLHRVVEHAAGAIAQARRTPSDRAHCIALAALAPLPLTPRARVELLEGLQA